MPRTKRTGPLPALLALLVVPALRGEPPREGSEGLREVIERWVADERALERAWREPLSAGRLDRLERFHEKTKIDLEGIDFDGLSRAARIDYLLLRNELDFRLCQIDHERRRQQEIADLVPFAGLILDLRAAQRRVESIDPAESAGALVEIREEVGAVRKRVRASLREGQEGDAVRPERRIATRAARAVDDLRRSLSRWHGFYAGYHPEFTWWTKEPYGACEKALETYAEFLRRDVGGRDDGAIIGDPIGREALLDALEHEMIPYTPEELIEIAEREFAWCEREMRRAANDLGFADDTRRALEHVKGLHVKPGEQPALIKTLAEEAVRFIEERDLITVPPLAKEVWRMRMMSPERQRVNPYFTGGEVISVSYPTSGMSHEDKLMSLRGNNIHFARATVHHELIPGHHLQGFMAARHNTHRRAFRTPFFVEGWALYWEMLLWDLGFPRSPEDRIGMLFWRSHRCARIIFSLRFHLGEMSAEEAIDYLVERVGHERRNATAEVRRSVRGGYPPLYQAAYMLGGLQLRALRRELVDSGKMSDRRFHDAVLRENAIPIELIRASLMSEPLEPDFSARWRFDGPEEAAGEDEERRETTADRRSEDRRARRDLVTRDRVEPHWFAGGDRFWYRVDLGAGRHEFILVDAVRGTRQAAFDHGRVAEALSDVTGETVEPDRLPVDAIAFSEDGRSLRLAGESDWVCNLETYRVVAAEADGSESDEDPPERNRRRGRRRSRDRSRRGGETTSPDGRWEAFVRDHDLWIRERESGEEQALTEGASADHSYARERRRRRSIGLDRDESEADAESAEPDVYWSPDSRHLVAMRHRPGTERLVYVIESAPEDQLQPKLHSYPYLKPGDDVPIRKPHLFAVESRQEVPVDDALFRNPWSIRRCRWSADSSRFTFLFNERGHQALRIIAVDAATGEARAIVDERSETFIDYSGKFFCEYLDETGEIIWMSERDGWNHLYLYDAQTGEVKNRITQGEWVVRRVERVDREKRQVWFRAGGIHPDQDPYHVHYCRVDLDGKNLVVLTEGNGTHSVRFSPDRRFFIDTWSRVDLPPVTELRRSADGALVCALETADASDLRATGWRPPERFVAKGRDGVTDIYGIIHWPRDVDADRKYPVIESIYAGPQGAFVPKSFRAFYRQEALTDLGFIVVQIDGMGTSHRSKAFHDVSWKNLGDAGLPDRILWMKAAAEKYPCMDLARVGIYGGSAGGQSALRALLVHGDFYKVAVADCGCHDNRMDKIWWNEQWMGWPVGPHYEEQSNVTQAHRLEGKLLLMVGELDRNVDPASTMQLVEALIRADKDFDLVVFPGKGHGAGGSRYGRRRRNEFFLRHLMGVEPP